MKLARRLGPHLKVPLDELLLVAARDDERLAADAGRHAPRQRAEEPVTARKVLDAMPPRRPSTAEPR